MNKNNEFEFEELKDKGSTLSVHTGDPIAIKEMQHSLNEWGYTDALGRKLSEDGIFGINTFNSVIKYQEDNGLYPDGVVGDKTWKSMAGRKKKDDTFWLEEENPKRNKTYDGANAEVSYLPEYKRNSPWEIPGDIKGIKNEGNNPAFPWDDFKPYPKNNEPDSSLYDGEKEDYMLSSVVPNLLGLYPTNSAEDNINIIEAIKKAGTDTVEAVKDGINTVRRKAEQIKDEALFKVIDSISNSEKLSEVTERIATFIKGNPDNEKAILNNYREMYDFENDDPKNIMIGIFDESLKIAKNNNDDIAQLTIKQTKDKFCNFDVSTINEVYYMNDSDGAMGAGHAGILLVNQDGESILFSYYPQNVGETKNSASEMRISVLGSTGTKNFLSGSGLLSASTSGKSRIEQYDRSKKFDISAEQGISMLQQGIAIAGVRPNYDLTTHNCDHMALSILWAGNIVSEKSWMPDKTFENMGGINA